ncbi:SsrA-binding protein SmpB [Candidatus Latescibacterota bacterium]
MGKKTPEIAAGTKLIAQNRKARYDYEILDTFEAGIALMGSEVKSLRDGKANLREGYARVEGEEVFLHNVHINAYGAATTFGHEPMRTRKLLLHREEIRRLIGQTEQKGLTLVPLRLYFKRGRAKVELGLARGKRQYDQRREIARRDAERAIDRALGARD